MQDRQQYTNKPKKNDFEMEFDLWQIIICNDFEIVAMTITKLFCDHWLIILLYQTLNLKHKCLHLRNVFYLCSEITYLFLLSAWVKGLELLNSIAFKLLLCLYCCKTMSIFNKNVRFNLII
jgi:hypothetical protein